MTLDRQNLEEAATWFARMRGPEAEHVRAEFEAWLARESHHRTAYSQISEVFSLGKSLPAGGSRKQDTAIGRSLPRAARSLAVIALTLTAVAGTAWLASDRRLTSAPSHVDGVAQQVSLDHRQVLQTSRGEIRRFQLPDGSGVILDTDSLVSVAYDVHGRRLRLERGRARFIVAHEQRPFTVAAAGGLVTAHGTIFDVRVVADKRIMVRLLRGAIDVDIPQPRRSKTDDHAVTRLSPGEIIAFSPETIKPATEIATGDEDDWPAAIREIEAVPVSALIAEANRYARRPISVISPEVGQLRLSGTFRIDDTQRLANNLAAVLHLRVDASDPGRIMLTRSCHDDPKIKCDAPS